MKVIFQSFLYCCLLATVAHCVELEVNPELKKSVSLEKTEESENFVRPEDIRDTLLPHSSTDINVRTKRSEDSANQSRRHGCTLGTCTVHDLAHRLHQLNNKFKIETDPVHKISP
ncbi:ADM-like [Larimichthys crocea]|uniref:ADM-like n=1 Tax=Larimichthys crocea TaxID=215358 RepID=UPI000F5F1F84|nr:ADM-like [Larimichthys crocea]